MADWTSALRFVHVLRAQQIFTNEDATARHTSLKPWLGRERARKLASPVASGRIHVDAASWMRSPPIRAFIPSRPDPAAICAAPAAVARLGARAGRAGYYVLRS